MESKVEFTACDNPHASKLTIHILAAVAEHEREMISARTQAALAAAKARGVALGNPRLQEIAGRGAKANRDKAAAFAKNVAPIIFHVQHHGAVSLRDVARELSARGVKTARGSSDWSAATVSRVLADLVVRLRRRGTRLCLEAADEIEELRAANRQRVSVATRRGLMRARREGKTIGGSNAESERQAAAARERAEQLRPVLLELQHLSAWIPPESVIAFFG